MDAEAATVQEFPTDGLSQLSHYLLLKERIGC
jgi:hypothetical protein